MPSSTMIFRTGPTSPHFSRAIMSPTFPMIASFARSTFFPSSLLCHEVGDARRAHPGEAVGQAVHLRVLPFHRLAHVVVDDQDLLLRKPPFHHQVLLACPEIGEDLERGVRRDLRHGERFELAHKNGFYRDPEPGYGLREDRLAADPVCIDVGDDGNFRCGRDQFRGCLYIIAKTHCHIFREFIHINCISHGTGPGRRLSG